MARIRPRAGYNLTRFAIVKKNPSGKNNHGVDGALKKGSLFGRNITLKNINVEYEHKKSYSLNRGSLIDFLNQNIEKSTLDPAQKKKFKLSKGFLGLGGSSNKKVRAAMVQSSDIFSIRKTEEAIFS